ncbi:PH domain-containing protein [Lysobacter sp. HA18]
MDGTRKFEIEPPAGMTVAMLAATAVLPMLVVAVLLAGMDRAADREGTVVTISAALLACAIAAGFAVLSLRRRRIELTPSQLVVKAGPFTRRIPREQLDVESARIAAAGEQADTRAALKLFGARLPGYRAGWFVMLDGHRAFVLATRGRVLRLPVRDAAPFVLTPSEPDMLLTALRSMVSSAPSR